MPKRGKNEDIDIDIDKFAQQLDFEDVGMSAVEIRDLCKTYMRLNSGFEGRSERSTQPNHLPALESCGQTEG